MGKRVPTQLQPNSLIAAITDRPVLVAPESERLFAAILQELASSEEFAKAYAAEPSAAVQDEDDFWAEDDPWIASLRPYTVTNGVLQIPVSGVLLNRFSFQFGRWATGYQYIERAFNRGMADQNVKAIAFVVDSPGGEVAGNFELVEKIVARRGEKPMKAFANDHAYSAAYSISTAADEIVMTRSGGVGSVGVVVAHVEYSDMLKEAGIRVTFIFAGKHKVEGNPYEKLSEGAKGRIQARVDRIYGEFVALVAENRDMDEEAVRETEALTYDASEAVEVGFADRVGAFEEEMAALSGEADDTENELMTTKNEAPAATKPEDGQTITQAQHDKAVADARAAGAQDQLTRINAILGSEEGKARPSAALSAALKTSMAADEAIAFLGSLPEEKAAAPAPAPAPAQAPKGDSPFNRAMSGSNDTVVGAGDGDTQTDGEKATTSADILGAFASLTGKKRGKAA